MRGRPPASKDAEQVLQRHGAPPRPAPSRSRRHPLASAHVRIAGVGRGTGRVGDRERGLEPEHARRGLVEGLVLALGRVRRVVGRDGVDDAVDERLHAAPRRRATVRSGGLTLKTGS